MSSQNSLTRHKVVNNLKNWTTSRVLANRLGCDFNNLTTLLHYYLKNGYIKRNKLKGNKYEYKTTKKGKSLVYSDNEYKKTKTELISELREQKNKVDRLKSELDSNKSLSPQAKNRYKNAYSGGQRGKEPVGVSEDYNLSDIANNSLSKDQLAILGLTPVINSNGRVYSIKRNINRDERVLSESEVLRADFRIDVSMSHNQSGNKRGSEPRSRGSRGSSGSKGKDKYYCPKCQQNHYFDSKIGNKHLKYVEERREPRSSGFDNTNDFGNSGTDF